MPEAPVVTIENGPQAEAAAAAAQTANLAAESAIATATALAAQAQSVAAERTAEIQQRVDSELSEREEEVSWLREHARLSAEHRENVSREIQQIQTEQRAFRETTVQALTGMELLLKSLLTPQAPATESLTETTPPTIPPEGGAVPRAQETPQRKRRLI